MVKEEFYKKILWKICVNRSLKVKKSREAACNFNETFLTLLPPLPVAVIIWKLNDLFASYYPFCKVIPSGPLCNFHCECASLQRLLLCSFIAVILSTLGKLI